MTLTISIQLIEINEKFYELDDTEILIYFPEFYQNRNLSSNFGDFEFNNKTSVNINY